MMFIDKLFLQKKYAEELSTRIDKFTIKRRSPFMANFRCHICGDSHKNKHKKRGFILEKDGGMTYYCHNGCGTINFPRYLKTYHPDLYQKYIFDLLKERKENVTRQTYKKNKFQTFIPPSENYLKELTNIRNNSKSFSYIKNRKIPEKFYEDIFYTDSFISYINDHVPGKFSEEVERRYDHPRIVFPFRDVDGMCFGVAGRSLNGEEPKYISIKFNEDRPKLFGLNRIERNRTVVVVEGIIDSMFIDNSIAMAGTDADLSTIEDCDQIIVLDNQPRNKEVLSKYVKYITAGKKVFIWPQNISSKDINQAILDGCSIEYMNDVIKTNCFSGVKAKIELNKWKKI